MTTAIRNVALAGASGNLGPALLDALLKANFNVTVLTRSSSTSTFPANVKVVHADYESLDSLTAALKDQDAFISSVTTRAASTQLRLIDAAVAAGVKRIIPSEFGSDTRNPKARQLPVFRDKIATQEYLEKKVKESDLTYTLILTGAFFDFGLRRRFVLGDSFYDGGDVPFSTTRLSTVGQTVVRVLQHPEETRNRDVCVHDAVVTQLQLARIAEKVTGKKWDAKVVSTADLEKAAYEELKKPAPNMLVLFGFIFRAIWGEGYGGEFKKVDNEWLGIDLMSEADIEATVKECATY